MHCDSRSNTTRYYKPKFEALEDRNAPGSLLGLFDMPQLEQLAKPNSMISVWLSRNLDLDSIFIIDRRHMAHEMPVSKTKPETLPCYHSETNDLLSLFRTVLATRTQCCSLIPAELRLLAGEAKIMQNIPPQMLPNGFHTYIHDGANAPDEDVTTEPTTMTSMGDDPEEEPEPEHVEQVIDWNADNDNGSTFTSELIPQVRDFDAGETLYEDDVLPLELDFDYADGPLVGVPKRHEWKLTYSEFGEGKMRFWDSPTKKNQLSPSANLQFTPLPPNSHPTFPSVEGMIPSVFLEGTHKSMPENDIEIDFLTKTEYWNAPTVITYYKVVNGTVAPVIKDMWVSDNQDPHFSNRTINPPTTGNGTIGDLQALVEFKTNFVKGVGGKVGYIQFVKDSHNLLLNNTTAKFLTNGTKLALVVMPQSLQQERNLGPNYTFPLLDGDPQSYPFYQNPTNLSQGNNIWQIKTTDSPGTPTDGTLQEVGFDTQYWMSTAWVQTSRDAQGNPTKTVAALTRIKWKTEFKFAGYQSPPGGMTTNNSPANVFEPARNANPHYETMAPNDIPRVASSYANDVHKFQPI